MRKSRSLYPLRMSFFLPASLNVLPQRIAAALYIPRFTSADTYILACPAKTPTTTTTSQGARRGIKVIDAAVKTLHACARGGDCIARTKSPRARLRLSFPPPPPPHTHTHRLMHLSRIYARESAYIGCRDSVCGYRSCGGGCIFA